MTTRCWRCCCILRCGRAIPTDSTPADAAVWSLHAVLEATEDELQTVEGVGPRSAELLHLCFALFHRYQADVAKMEQFTDKLNTYDRIGAYFVPQLCAEREEVLLAAYVDGAGRVLKCEEIARGGHARVQVDSYKIARGALMAGCGRRCAGA